MATALPSVVDHMKCPICLDYATKAVETVCCGQIYCEKCIEDLVLKECPSCRDPSLETIVSRLARKMVGELPAECPNSCEEKVTRSTLESHTLTCPQREYPCPVAGCEFSGLFEHLVEHEGVKHKKKVFLAMQMLGIEKAEQNIQTDATKAYFCPFEDCADLDEMSAEILKNHFFENHSGEIEIIRQILAPKVGPIKIRNSFGDNASMAPNGKFYCNSKYGAYTPDKYKPNTADRIACTYGNKLNCVHCMELDVSLRNLPIGSLVNGSGHVSTPFICTHPVDESLYSDQKKRDASCLFKTCGHWRKFSCGMPDIDRMDRPLCTERGGICKACRDLNYVYCVAAPDGVTDMEYYKTVWNEK